MKYSKFFSSLLSLMLAVAAWPALATEVKFSPSVSIPGSVFQRGQEVLVTGATKTICDYIVAYYQYGIGILAVVAVVIIAVSGLIWVTSFGNAGKIARAKSRIFDAILGLAVALFSFVILSTINKELVVCKNLQLPSIATKEAQLAKGIMREPICKMVAGNSCSLGYSKAADNTSCTRPDGSLNGDDDSPSSCCCPNQDMERSDFCQQAGEGAACKVNGAWGYCEDIDGRGLICRSCKKITGKAKQQGITPADFADSDRCYRSSANWECAGANSMCGKDGIDADCNMMLLNGYKGPATPMYGPLDSCWSSDLFGRGYIICVCQ